MYNLHILRNAVHDICVVFQSSATLPHSYPNLTICNTSQTEWRRGNELSYSHTLIQHSNRRIESQSEWSCCVNSVALSQSFSYYSGMLISLSSLFFQSFNRDLNAIYFVWLYNLAKYHFSINVIVNYYLISKYSQPSIYSAFVIAIESMKAQMHGK